MWGQALQGEGVSSRPNCSQTEPVHTFKTNVFKLSGISSRLQRRTSWISQHWVVSLGLEAWKTQHRHDDYQTKPPSQEMLQTTTGINALYTYLTVDQFNCLNHTTHHETEFILMYMCATWMFLVLLFPLSNKWEPDAAQAWRAASLCVSVWHISVCGLKVGLVAQNLTNPGGILFRFPAGIRIGSRDFFFIWHLTILGSEHAKSRFHQLQSLKYDPGVFCIGSCVCWRKNKCCLRYWPFG